MILSDDVVLLVDGDNTSHELLPRILRLVGDEATGTVFCNPCSLPGWSSAIIKTPCRFQISKVYSKGRNSVDTAIIFAMLGMKSGKTLVIATRDADFSGACCHLRSTGVTVLSLSVDPPGKRLRLACDGWIEMSRNGQAILRQETPVLDKSPRRKKAKSRSRREAHMRHIEEQIVSILQEEGVTPLPRLQMLCDEASIMRRDIQPDLICFLRARESLFHVSGGDTPRISLMTPERAVYDALVASLTASSPLPLRDLPSTCRKYGQEMREMAEDDLVDLLQARPDLFRIVTSQQDILVEIAR